MKSLLLFSGLVFALVQGCNSDCSCCLGGVCRTSNYCEKSYAGIAVGSFVGAGLIICVCITCIMVLCLLVCCIKWWKHGRSVDGKLTMIPSGDEESGDTKLPTKNHTTDESAIEK